MRHLAAAAWLRPFGAVRCVLPTVSSPAARPRGIVVFPVSSDMPPVSSLPDAPARPDASAAPAAPVHPGAPGRPGVVDPVPPSDRHDLRSQPEPVTYDAFPARGELPILAKTRCPKFARWMAVLLMVGLAATVVLMAVAPWQQNVKGTGSVINFNPTVRPQPVEAPISGRVMRLGEGIREMALVEKGQLIAELSDLDPDRLDRLRTNLESERAARRSAEDALVAAQSELRQAKTAVEVYRGNVETLKAVRREAVATAESYVQAAKEKKAAAEQLINDRQAILDQLKLDYERQKTLNAEGIAGDRKFQAIEQQYRSAQAALAKAQADLRAAEADVIAKEKERETKDASAQASVEVAEATLANAEARVQSATAGVASAEQSLQKATVTLTNAETAVRRQENQDVVAPIGGYLVALYTDAGGSIVKEGEPIARIVPESDDRVVEIWLDGNDAPLVQPGRHVRLQFEGWPAIQFAGWPSVAVGTFGGEVLSVDATDNGRGMFRMLVKEVSGVDKQTGLVEEPWPQGRFLRPGVRANAWVLLDTVPLWWEVWRNLNGFPPVVEMDEDETTKNRNATPKTPKLPKL